MTLKEIRDMSLGTGGRHSWRLRSLDEEAELSAKQTMIEGAESFETAFARLESGDRESAIAALKRVVALAERAIDSIDDQ